MSQPNKTYKIGYHRFGSPILKYLVETQNINTKKLGHTLYVWYMCAWYV